MCIINLGNATPNPVTVAPIPLPALDGPFLLEAYIANPEWGLRIYDDAPVEQDNALGSLEIFVCRLLGITGIGAPPLALLNNDYLLPINEALVDVPNNISLYQEEADDAPLWDALTDLFGNMLIVPGVGSAIATKILHKKRPRLIPIVDRRLYQIYYPGNVGAPGALLVQVVQAIRQDIIANLPALQALQAAFPELDGLTIIRVFDIIVWTAVEVGIVTV